MTMEVSYKYARAGIAFVRLYNNNTDARSMQIYGASSSIRQFGYVMSYKGTGGGGDIITTVLRHNQPHIAR